MYRIKLLAKGPDARRHGQVTRSLGHWPPSAKGGPFWGIYRYHGFTAREEN